MKNKYIVTKLETIRRTEKVQYEVLIPEKIRNKEEYTQDQLEEGNYKNCKMVDIVDSEMLDDEIISLTKKTEGEKLEKHFG
ncbi:MAG: hypothetical protein COT33_00220 [Candidatus Nealsonbacteria bacterium CG08_land_8_20_14_0_20_38_20]|uniref:Uncharacterized protein n=1 Tax=Candidatus Nealsonbacteria bacterium CG08_land_8_20_14_0_20_38_20 TaxID=1974705 RepID=A0A2H0YPS5_9BACT|nr:MAG: hypothetical protein COT33_00220 [Candidatus Nealsonbacteria bacterium CG08_land_8_20_14_0_20_38_20]